MERNTSRATLHPRGFTIVELLIVIVVIAILAAITIVAYNGIQNRAKHSAVQSAAKQASTKIQAYAVQNSDQYPSDANAAGLPTADSGMYQWSVNNNATPRTYCVTVTAQNISYYVSNTNSTPILGGCAGHSQNGVPTITNLITNPAIRTNSVGWGTQAAGASGGAISGQGSLSFLGLSTAYRVSTTATSGWWRARVLAIPVEANQTYYLSAYLRPSVTLSTTVIIQWIGPSGLLSEKAGVSELHTSNTWARRIVSGSAPAEATSANLFFGVSSGTPVADGTVFDVTAAMFYKGTVESQYADGNTADWLWNGTPNNATSIGPPVVN